MIDPEFNLKRKQLSNKSFFCLIVTLLCYREMETRGKWILNRINGNYYKDDRSCQQNWTTKDTKQWLTKKIETVKIIRNKFIHQEEMMVMFADGFFYS